MQAEIESKTTNGVIEGEQLINELNIQVTLNLKADNQEDRETLTSVLAELDKGTIKDCVELLTLYVTGANEPKKSKAYVIN